MTKTERMDNWEKAVIISYVRRLLDDGRTIESAALAVGVPLSTVDAWLKADRATGVDTWLPPKKKRRHWAVFELAV